MGDGAVFAIFNIGGKLLDKLRKKSYRVAYVGEHIGRGVAYQIRALRDQRSWKQGELAKRLGKPQSVVCRLEDPSYGKMSVQTLLEVANVFDVALQVRFVPFSSFLRDTRDVSAQAMQVPSFDEEVSAAASPTSSDVLHEYGEQDVTSTEEELEHTAFPGAVVPYNVYNNVYLYSTPDILAFARHCNVRYPAIFNTAWNQPNRFVPAVEQHSLVKDLKLQIAERDRRIIELEAKNKQLESLCPDQTNRSIFGLYSVGVYGQPQVGM
jgi:transcriptional regulator with XRE-family HTH domain